MKLRLPILFFVISLWLCSRLAFAGVEQISEKEFRALAEELSPKVNLFAETWKQNPEAEFYGGTTRDYLYWLKGQFREASSPKEAAAIVGKLRAMPMIDVRDFIIGDSDVDIISKEAISIKADDFGVRKIDWQPFDILDPKTEAGQNEILQGYIPAEKIRLGRQGIPPATLGDGIFEIYQGKLSVHFASPEDFAKSKYAKEGINHPTLLALRYLRLQAINYYRTHGKGYPDKTKLQAAMEEKSAAAVRAVIQDALVPGNMKEYLGRDRFKSWFNGAIQKAFRSYTNPTAALELMKDFRVPEFASLYAGQVQPLNQYLFTQHRDPVAIEQKMREHKVDKSAFFENPRQRFADGYLYHGTKTEEAFRGILFQGILPSEGGSAQGGLYGVAEKNKSFSENWAGDKNRLLRFELSPEAKIVDITKGEGEKIWLGSKSLHGGDTTKFAEIFGIDIIAYPYTPEAFVVKNAAVLGRAQGVHRSLMSFSQILEKSALLTDPAEVFQMLSVNRLSAAEQKIVWENTKVTTKDVVRYMLGGNAKNADLAYLAGQSPWREEAAVKSVWREWITSPYKEKRAIPLNIFREENRRLDTADIQAIDRIFSFFGVDHADRKLALGIFLQQEIATPSATAFALHDIKISAASPLTSAYLSLANLNEEELAELYRIFESNPGHFYLAVPPMLKHGYRSNDIRDQYLARLERIKEKLPVEADRHSLVWLELKVLADNFPDDPSTKKRMLELAQADVKQALNGKNSYMPYIYPKLAPDQAREVKGLVLTGLKSDSRQARDGALNLLTSMDLEDSDLAEVFRRIDMHNFITEGQFEQIAKKYEGKMGSESAEALLDLYLRSQGESQSKVKRVLTLNQARHQSQWRAYLAKRLDHEGIQTPERWSREEELRKISSLFVAGIVPTDDELIEKSLVLIERTFPLKENYGRAVAGTSSWFITDLPLADPALSRRVQGLMVMKAIQMDHTDHFIRMVEKMPELTEEFRGFTQRLITNMIETERAKPNTVFRQQLERLQALNARAASPQKTGCPGQFAQLAP